MATLQGPVICRPAVHAKETNVHTFHQKNLMRIRLSRSRFWGSGGKFRQVQVGLLARAKPKSRSIKCSFSSSSDGSGSMAENFSESDEDYVMSSVIEAVEVRSGSDGFVIKMRDGKHVRCVHNSPQGGQLPDYAPHPAIVLKMEDGSELLLPIIVLEMPSVLLMAAVRNVQMARPTVYQVVKEMIEKMGYEVQLVRVTRRVHEAYFAKLYLAKANKTTLEAQISVRFSLVDRLGMKQRELALISVHQMLLILQLGARLQMLACLFDVPIQVNKQLAYSDGMRIVEPSKLIQAPLSDGLLFTELDRPDGQPCMETIEFNLVRNMLIAAVEERYKDAGIISFCFSILFLH
ncbi:hypothetical protein Taro_030710 [Colocasia esculenta]|uniref:BFN domain-containing protein n=1 Tax=Colocasia esculenta TaxID=4460 RepID=A0A843VH02_COLES|nr:hypothetical protein [Colocasia esculenta]